MINVCKTLKNRFLDPTDIRLLWIYTAIAFSLHKLAQLWLDSSYAASKFPVPFYVGQTAFDGQIIKGYYQHLLNEGTLDIYIQTQFIDFAFIVSAYAFLLLLLASATRLMKPGKLKNLSWVLTFVFSSAPIFDVLENAVSFIMLANPLTFPDWLAYPYSTFAVTKFGLWGLAYSWAGVAIIIAGTQHAIYFMKNKK